jgi:hypothetical protein
LKNDYVVSWAQYYFEILEDAHVAQQAERHLGKVEVAGSSPVVGSMN